jgi:phage shock protein PspC (stress-responsive transcriptional regulator)
VVEHFHGKEGVSGSNPEDGSNFVYSTGVGVITRNADNALITGVSAGIADAFNVDIKLIRSAFLLLVLVYGFGVTLYILFLMLMRNQPSPSLEP